MEARTTLAVGEEARRIQGASLPVLFAAVAVLLSAALPTLAGTASAAFTFNFGLGSSCMSGQGPNNDLIHFTQKNAEGTVKGRRSATSDGTGYWSLTSCFSQSIESGDKIAASDGVLSRTFTVPTLSVTGNRQTDAVAGFGPHNSALKLYLNSCITFSCSDVKDVMVTTDASGTYHHDFTAAHDIKGGDYVYVYWSSAHNDTVYTYGYFPYVDVVLGRSDFYGYANAGQLVSVSLRNGTTVKGAAKGVGSIHGGFFDADFRRRDGSPALPDPGNKVVSSFGASITLVSLTVAGHAASDTVTGTCPAHRPFEVYAHDPSYPYRANDYAYFDGVATATGHVSADMTADYPSFNLLHGDEVILSCKLASGDIEGVSALVP